MKLAKKKEIVKDLNAKFLKAKVVILTDYKGLDVAKINDLRRQLGEADVEYKVVKNTLLTLASEKTDSELIKDSFKGPSAVAMSYDDPVAPAKVLTKFMEENTKLEIKIGVMDGRILDLSAIKTLAKLPDRDVLLAQLLSTFCGVPTSLVRLLSTLPGQLLNVLQALKQQKEAA